MSMKVVQDTFTPWLKGRDNAIRDAKEAFGKYVQGEEKELQKLSPKGASSNLYNSFPAFTQIRTSGTDWKGRVGSDSEYGVQVFETGRAPGKAPSAKPGSPLDRWAKQKGMNAYAVAKKIGKVGTKKFRNKGPKLLTQYKQELDGRTSAFMNRVSNILIK